MEPERLFSSNYTPASFIQLGTAIWFTDLQDMSRTPFLSLPGRNIEALWSIPRKPTFFPHVLDRAGLDCRTCFW